MVLPYDPDTMSAEHERGGVETTDAFTSRVAWKGGAVSGLIATAIMGVAITIMDLSTLREAIAGLYGFQGNFFVGWIAHLTHGTLFGLIFAVVLADPILHRVGEWLWKSIAAGVVYSVVLAVAGAGVIMPVWLTIVGFNEPPTVPFVTVPILVWHLIYGLVLGTLYYTLNDI